LVNIVAEYLIFAAIIRSIN